MSITNKKVSTFSERLKEAMTIRNLIPADLVRMTGIDKGSISNYLNGRYTAGQINTDKLSSALNVSISWLMGFDTPMSKKSFSNQLEISPERQEIIDKLLDLSDENFQKIQKTLLDILEIL